MSMTLRLAKQLSIDLLQHGLIPRRFGAWSASVRVGLTYLAGCLSTLAFLVVVSTSIVNWASYQGYASVAFATPTKTSRLIRQVEVAHFGERVSEAFGVHQQLATEFADWIIEGAERQQLEPELLASLVVTESSFRKHARSSVGAIGPAQIRPDYWGEFCGQNDLLDPEQNVYCGAQILAYMLERCSGETACALAAYNVGLYARRVAAAERYLEKIDFYMRSFPEAS
ncbi:MAG: lytic transglycosylase domain-containing protein [Pseudomonadales bacterium]|nr:lytic transglycosylase domain-containing protein [Pseudomonadales bacterium]